MKIPQSKRRTALLAVDLQPRFINDRIRYIVENIASLIEHRVYDLIIQSHISADENTLWFKQHGWLAPIEGNMSTISPLGGKFAELGAITVRKTTRSLFKGDLPVNEILRAKQIEEIHIVGVDTYDCITATAHEAFDLGYFTYLIEECCQSTSSQELHDRALQNLRYVNLTNNSCRENVEFDVISCCG